MDIGAYRAEIVSPIEAAVSVIVLSLFFQEQIWGRKLIGILMAISLATVVQLN